MNARNLLEDPIFAATELGKPIPDSPHAVSVALPRWQDVLANLTEFPTDENGYRIGRDQPFDTSHRHYSHLLMIYPYYIVNDDQPEHRDLIRTSVGHWMRSTGAFAGSGIPQANGETDYFTMLNERDGGIGGVKIVVELKDECPEFAQESRIKELLDEKAAHMCGLFNRGDKI